MKPYIIKAEDLPEDAKVYLKKQGNNYRVVHPIKNEDGSWNWFNLFTGGSWFNVLVVGVVVLIILGVLLEYSVNIKVLQDQLATCFPIDISFG